jgi:hypothetical protein
MSMRMASILLLGLLSAPAAAQEESMLFKVAGWAVTGTATGDLATTEYGLSRGFTEANPLVRNRGVRFGTHVAITVATNHVTARLHQHGHTRAALWVRLAVAGAYGYAVAHNLRTLK